jgi:adenine phosphoribosyltransferase
MELKEKIRVIPDYPQKGIRFKDITTLLQDGAAFHQAISNLADEFRHLEIDLVVGPEARGFVIGAPVAYSLKAGFIPVRKPGKLPSETVQFEYSLEYGKDALEVHKDAISPGQKVLIIDDLLATGGTTQATIGLVEKLGGIIVGIGFLIELTYLEGRKCLDKYQVVSLIKY